MPYRKKKEILVTQSGFSHKYTEYILAISKRKIRGEKKVQSTSTAFEVKPSNSTTVEIRKEVSCVYIISQYKAAFHICVFKRIIYNIIMGKQQKN